MGLTNLISLDLSGLDYFPAGIFGLTLLRELSLSGCNRQTEHILEDIGCLTSLQVLNLGGWNNLQVLPQGLTTLSSLTSLDVSGCYYLRSLPPGLMQLAGLRLLDIRGCRELVDIAEGFRGMRDLRIIADSGVSWRGQALDYYLCIGREYGSGQ